MALANKPTQNAIAAIRTAIRKPQGDFAVRKGRVGWNLWKISPFYLSISKMLAEHPETANREIVSIMLIDGGAMGDDLYFYIEDKPQLQVYSV